MAGTADILSAVPTTRFRARSRRRPSAKAGTVIPIPRHTELGETFAVEIFKECQNILGKGWWRK
jgi:hypothetical protein